MAKLKGRYIALISVATVLVVLGSALLIYYFGASYPEFDEISQSEVLTPGLDEGFIPQGLAVAEVPTAGMDFYIVTGYMKDAKLKSRVYLTPTTLSEYPFEPYFITLEGTSNDKALPFGHLGGVATTGDIVWICTEEYVMRLSLATMRSAKNGDSVAIIDEFKVENAASFCYANEDNLYVGEYYKEKKFPTREANNVKTADGENNAIVAEFEIDATKPNAIMSTVPNKIISVTNQVQGFAISPAGKIVLSTSYGMSDSILYVYNDPFAGGKDGDFTIADGTKVPLYILDSTNAHKEIKTPSMTEGIDFYNGRLHILYESASVKYKAVVRTRVKDILSVINSAIDG